MAERSRRDSTGNHAGDECVGSSGRERELRRGHRGNERSVRCDEGMGHDAITVHGQVRHSRKTAVRPKGFTLRLARDSRRPARAASLYDLPDVNYLRVN